MENLEKKYTNVMKKFKITGTIIAAGFDDKHFFIKVDTGTEEHDVYVNMHKLLPAVVVSKEFISIKRNQKVYIKGLINTLDPFRAIFADNKNSIVELL
jgi:hypothetical protein